MINGITTTVSLMLRGSQGTVEGNMKDAIFFFSSFSRGADWNTWTLLPAKRDVSNLVVSTWLLGVGSCKR